MKGLIEDIQTANRLAVCFRKDGSQLVFVLLTRIEFMNDVNFKLRGKVGVRRTDLLRESSKEDDLVRSGHIVEGEGYKILEYRQFSQVLKRMQADADVALQIQMTLRYVPVCH